MPTFTRAIRLRLEAVLECGLLPVLVALGGTAVVLLRPIDRHLTAASVVPALVALTAIVLAALVLRRRDRRMEEIHSRLLTHLPLATYVDAVEESVPALWISSQFEELLGYPLAAWVEDPDFFSKVLHPDDRARVLEEHAVAARRLEPICTDYRLVSSTGRTVWVHDQAVVRHVGGRATWQGFLLDVTARKEAEEAGRASEERYRLIVETASEGIWVTDAEHRTAFVNAAMADLLGTTVEELRARSAQEFMDAEHWRIACAKREERRATKRRDAYEFTFRRTDGTEVHTLVSAAAMLDEAGEYVASLAMVSDVTELRRAADELHRTQELYRLVVENSTSTISLLDPDGTIVFASPSHEAVLGRSPESLTGTDARELLHPDDAAEVVAALGRCVTGEAATFRARIRHRDGSWRVLEGTPTAIRDGDGEVTALVAISRDVTGEKEVESARRQLAALVESSSDAIIGSTADRIVQSWNAGAERLYGYTAEEIVGKSVHVLAGPGRDPEIVQLVERLRRGETIQNFETVRRRKDGSLIDVSLTLSPILDSGGELVAVSSITRDITEQRRLEQQLQHARKMEAVGQLAGGIAHDFNNSLMAIRGFTDLLLERLDDEDPRRSHAEGIRKAAEGATSVTRQLLAFSRKQMLRPRVVDLNENVHGLADMLRQLIGTHVRLELRTRAEESHVRADPGQLEQVIVNLAVNARDAMGGGGTLTIETESIELDQELAGRMLELPAGRYVLLTVSDTGEGMAADVRARVFEPFFSTKEQGLGTGLGLSTVYGIVKQSGGSVHVYSEPGRGSSFKVYLPRVDSRPAVRQPEPADAPGGDETILLVEDEDVVRALLREMLTRRGYTVVDAAHGARALELLEEHPVDVLLTDVVMPDMAGPQLARRVKTLRPDAGVIYMSGYTNDTVLERDAGGDVMFLEKPFSADKLARTLRGVLDAGARAPAENGARST